MLKTHTLKLREPYFTDVASGKKSFELRQYSAQGADKPARDFAIHDTIRLIPAGDDEGTVFETSVSYILRDTDPCMEGRLPLGYCILGLRSQPTIDSIVNDIVELSFKNVEPLLETIARVKLELASRLGLHSPKQLD